MIVILLLFKVLYILLKAILYCRYNPILSFSVFTNSVVHGSHVVPGLALEVHPVVPVLPAERQTILVVHVVGFPLVPGGEVPGVPTGPLPLSLSYNRGVD